MGLNRTYKTNCFNLPLLHIVCITFNNQSFSLDFCLMHTEREETYIWTLQQFRILFCSHSHPSPTCFYTVCELAPINALEVFSPGPYHLLCVWHINTNFFLILRKSSISHNNQEEVNKLWNQLLLSGFKRERIAEHDSNTDIFADLYNNT